MELPDLGKHCSEPTCRQLDFLPMKCDACDELFCKNHITYDQHTCPSAYKKDVQVPVCPLCSAPIPVKRGEMADIAVSKHIDRNCKFDLSNRKQKIFKSRCLKPGCKKKELMEITCDHCQNNFCISHRHPLDHDCKSAAGMISKAGFAALNRSKLGSQEYNAKVKEISTSTRTEPSENMKYQQKSDLPYSEGSKVISGEIQNRMEEDEALQRALELSLLETGLNHLLTISPEEEDWELQQALEASREEHRRLRRKAVKVN
ncbi:hypothetical protein GDO86_013179 [Hymenochirus boettgeri]|uniref:AN1-type domain-containing protein n=2 Tax=Hymenochirus boettgeri TaxID=247094 RepID=A0A8T2IRC6_9PIPI|nr:hypothetical protein GDO86_017333 [Hymenochirus boettgeri]KAG8435128.1 hypothetical protein GDO86_013179 [Hymenochirus boettgeri]